MNKKEEFIVHVDVSLGVGILPSVIDELERYSGNEPLLLYDANLIESDLFQIICEKLQEQFPAHKRLANEGSGEPTYQYLEQLVGQVRKWDITSIIAIGGGSTIDLGKGLALLYTNRVSALSLKGFPEEVRQPLPLITVPSVSGSGSEVSYNAVFIDESEGRKLGINSKKNFPVKAIVDPVLSMTAPEKAVISSALDTLVHCIDSYGSPKSTCTSRMFSREGFNQVWSCISQDDLSSAVKRMGFARGSIYGINALMNSGDGPTNGFAYYFGVKHGIPHGIAGGMFLRDIISWNLENGYEGYSELFNANGSSVIRGFTSIYERYSVPTLKDFGYTLSDVDDLAKEVSHSLSGSFQGNPIPFDIESAREVLRDHIQNEGP